MLYLGTNRGRILKVYDLSPQDPDQKKNPDPVLVESARIFPEDIPVRNLMIARSQDAQSRLVALSEHEVLSMPLHRCGRATQESCQGCLALRDPRCAWDPVAEACVEWKNSGMDSDRIELLWQELETGRREECDVLTNAILLAGEIDIQISSA